MVEPDASDRTRPAGTGEPRTGESKGANGAFTNRESVLFDYACSEFTAHCTTGYRVALPGFAKGGYAAKWPCSTAERSEFCAEITESGVDAGAIARCAEHQVFGACAQSGTCSGAVTTQWRSEVKPGAKSGACSVGARGGAPVRRDTKSVRGAVSDYEKSSATGSVAAIRVLRCVVGRRAGRVHGTGSIESDRGVPRRDLSRRNMRVDSCWPGRMDG
jgi:hypothetical protein